MAHFEIDLPSALAKRFDNLLNNFLISELGCRRDVDVQTAAYVKEAGIERRSVFVSDEAAMQEFRRRWAEDLQRSGTTSRKTMIARIGQPNPAASEV